MNLIDIEIKNAPKFSTLELAQSFANRTVKPSRVVVGDDNKFWVTTPRVAEELTVNRGFKMAE
jgi:hypothetical protein